ncbi:MAG: CocE/NonD family hydrolase [Steroidobacterales bacterium]
MNPVCEIENAWITLADGCRLAARLFLPADAQGSPVPAILEYIPYRKRDFMRRRDDGMHRWFAGHGYACVRVDMRGSGESDGIMHDEYLKLEQDDALEVIAWIAAQPWCSGRVGMMGKSWGAYNSLQVAARRPAALKAVLAVMGTDDRYAECIHYSGGCLLNDNFWWGCIMQVFNARPPDPAIVGERWRSTWLQRLEAEQFWPDLWLRHPHLDEYWKHGSVAFDYDAIACPVWFWGGWADLYRDTPLRLAQNLRVAHKVTIGPWAHLYPHEGLPAPAVGFLQEALRWWDHWLKDRDNGLMREPTFHVYLMDSARPLPYFAARAGRWIAGDERPADCVDTESFALNCDGLGAAAGPEGVLMIGSPQSTGLASGDWGSFANSGDLPGEQDLDAFGSLQFDTPPLAAVKELLGNARVTLEFAADQPDALVAVRLIDVAPGGSATCVARGFLNLAQRDSREAPSPLVPGRRYRAEVSLTGTAYAFPAGHRLRVALSTAYWPIIWPSPHAVALSVFTGVSRLHIPVLRPSSMAAAARPFASPVSATQCPVTTLRKGRIERTVATDQISGEVTHRLFIDGGVFGDWGKFRLDDIGMDMAHVFERIYSIRPDDPASARASMTQTYEMGRGDWQVTIRTGATMSSTPATFELDAWLEAYDGDARICRREWRSSIPRRNL